MPSPLPRADCYHVLYHTATGRDGMEFLGIDTSEDLTT